MLPTNPLLNATAPAGPHLPVALLRQYAAGTLAAAAQHRVEAHTLACPRCADILTGLLQTPPATTDQALAQLQQRLRSRVQQQAAPARQGREQRQNRWLVPQLAAAAALIFGMLAGGWWAWQQRQASHRASPVLATTTAARPQAARQLVEQPASPDAVRNTPAPKLLAKPLAPAKRAATHRPLAAHRTAGTANHTKAPAPPAFAVTEHVDEPAPQPLATPAAAAVGRIDTASSGVLARGLSNLATHPAQAAASDAAPMRLAAMPAVPKLAPTPVGGTGALREKLRREASEFVPERPLSGTVQLRLTIGSDGKIQQTKVLRGLREDYDAEAQRLVCDGPGWVPGISGGRRATLEVDVAVPF